MNTTLPRILFVSNLYPDSKSPGRGIMNARLLWTLADRGVPVSVVSPRAKAPGAFRRSLGKTPQDPLPAKFINVSYIPCFGSRWNDQLMKRRLRLPLRNAIERFRPDLILGAWMYPDGCAVSALAEELDLPCFLIAQGTDLHSYLKDEVRKTKILRSVDQSITTITRSRSLEALLTSAGADSNKVRTIYNGVDTTLFRPGCREAARAQLGISEDISLALFVGNLLPVKNPELLLHALAQMKKPPLLLMVGDGPLRSRLSTLANDLKIAHSVRLTGRKSPKEVSRYMHAADVLCLSSHNEGLPNVILEAFASGLPVVATNVGGVSEVVNSPILGTLVTPGNPHEFSQALEARLLMRTDREAISKTGADYSWNRTCDLYLETFNRFPDKDFLTTKQQSPC